MTTPRYQTQAVTAPYRVPFAVDRDTPPWYRLIHLGDEHLRGVTLSEIDAAGDHVSSTPPRRLAPGEALPFSVRSRSPALGTVVVVRWFRPDGSEYLWRVSF